MAEQKFTNDVITTLAADVAIGAASMQVASASGLPSLGAGDWFIAATFPATGVAAGALIEVVKVTAVVGTTCTITRAQEGTTDTGMTSGDVVIISPPSKGTFEQLQNDIDAAEADILTIAGLIAANAADIATNAAAIAAISEIEATTVMLFGQASAPTGWTKKTDWADESVLVYSTGALSSGGSAKLNDHIHPGGSHTHSNGSLYIDDVVKHRHVIQHYYSGAYTSGETGGGSSSSYLGSGYTAYAGSSSTVNVKGATEANSANTGAVDTDIKYQEVIAATKD